MRSCRVVRADPAGNVTVFVLDAVAKEERAGLAGRLIASFGADQVGFRCPPQSGSDGRLEMAGGEFCGNATRAYAALLAKERGLTAPTRLLVEVSGAERPVAVDVDPVQGTARAEMPLPLEVRAVRAGGVDGVLVDLGGIVHFVAENVEPSESFFAAAESSLDSFSHSDACGVMFLQAGKMTPLVKVPAVGTLIREGSCGSGSLAAAAAQSMGLTDGAFCRAYHQPAGTVTARVERRDGKIVSAAIGGAVGLDEPTVFTW